MSITTNKVAKTGLALRSTKWTDSLLVRKLVLADSLVSVSGASINLPKAFEFNARQDF
jgi:hypothetical protein